MNPQTKHHLMVDIEAAGKQVSKLSVEWRESFHCQLSEDLRVNQIRYTEAFKDEQEAIEEESTEARLGADFYLMTGHFRRFLEDWVKAFGDLGAYHV